MKGLNSRATLSTAGTMQAMGPLELMAAIMIWFMDRAMTLLLAMALVFSVKVVFAAPDSSVPDTGAGANASNAKVAQMNVQQYKRIHLQAVESALAGRTQAALISLAALVQKKDLPADERNRIHLSIGRIHYQQKEFSKALASFGKVESRSAAWFEALEEKAWTLMQLNRPEEALASLKSVLSPLFKDKTSSEPFFLTALAQLRVCDYKALFQTLQQFKDRFRDRVKVLEISSDAFSRAQLKEVKETIQKLNLVEAEAIQRLYMEEDGRSTRGSVPKIVRSSRELTFPEVPGEEVWVDEVEDIRVAVKKCPRQTEALASQSTQQSTQSSARRPVEAKEKSL